MMLGARDDEIGRPDAAARAGPAGGDPQAPAGAVVRGGDGVLRRLHGPAGREHRHRGVPCAAAAVRRGLAGVQWVSLGYLLALVALLVPAGRWSDKAGRKLSYLAGFVVFA